MPGYGPCMAVNSTLTVRDGLTQPSQSVKLPPETRDLPPN